MTARKVLITGVLLVLTLTLTAGPLFAGGIKERMKKRRPEIVKMKAQGIIGENNRGYLEYVSSQKPNPELVAGENRDRLTVYKAIAAQQGVTLEIVEKRRVLQIVKKANPGEFLQRGDGTWYKKQ